MAIRLQQMHPGLVHVPFTLLPLAIGVDLIGRISRDQSLIHFGRRAIELAGVGVIANTAYLGGKLVDAVGVGAEPAKGVYRTDAQKCAKQHAHEEVAGINRPRGAYA